MEYKADIKAEAKHLFIEKEKSARAIARHFKGRPSAGTIDNWASAKDDDGNTWKTLRKEKAEMMYLDMSPNNMANVIMRETMKLLQNPDIDPTKKADGLSKFKKAFEEMTDIDKQIPVMYHMLQDYILYCKTNYPNLVTEEFIESNRAYKNHIRARLNNDFS